MSDKKIEQDTRIWADKYQPFTIAECILPKVIKAQFESFVKQKNFPRLLLTGDPGVGKTSTAEALCEEMGLEVTTVNGTKDGNIDFVKNQIRQVCSTISFSHSKKCIILDEADGLTKGAQTAMRGTLDDYKHMHFIFICNDASKLDKALHSRTDVIEFAIQESEKDDMINKFSTRVFEILAEEKISFDKGAVNAIIKKYYPDNRKILNKLQGACGTEAANGGILLNSKDAA